jgi:hypothetical protein
MHFGFSIGILVLMLLVCFTMENEVPIKEERDRDGNGGRDGASDIVIQGWPKHYLDADTKPINKAKKQDESYEAASPWVIKNEMTV